MTTPTTEHQLTTVLLGNAHPLMRKGLRAVLESEVDIVVVGEAGAGQEAVDQVRSLSPDVVIMDVTLPEIHGVETALRILAEAPSTRIIALSIQSEQCSAEAMLEAGVRACVPRERALECVSAAIRAVMRGESPPNAASPASPAPLTSWTAASPEHRQPGDDAPTPQAGVATDPILRTKLHRPALPPDRVIRSRVLERLEAGRVRPLTLVSAPAGYGKSITVSSWLETCTDWPSVWLSLDPDDSDLRQFLHYFLATVQRAFPGACEQTQGLIHSHQLPSLATLTASLSNGLDAIASPFILVLDDYHRIDAGSLVNELLHQLLAHPPIPLHLVIVCRRDPALQLATLRGLDQITEIRMQGLRFDIEETTALLECIPGFTPSDDMLAGLQRELEGWVVGLRLVSLVLRRRQDRDGLLQSLHGGIHHIREYLTQEVISQQTPMMQDWLVRCAILNRFREPLVRAVCTGQTDAVAADTAPEEFVGEGFIDRLVTGNLFVIPLDSGKQWFRYHHQFEQLLRHELTGRMTPAAIAELHSRASAWFESQGLIEESIQHAVKAGDLTGDLSGAADIVERHQQDKVDQDQWYIVEQWLAMLPPAIVQRRPRLLLVWMWGLYNAYQMLEIPPLIERLESLLVDETADQAMLAELNFYRGFILAIFHGDPKGARIQFEQARDRFSQSPIHVIVGEFELVNGVAHQLMGEGGQAIRALEQRIQALASGTGLVLSRMVAGLVFIRLLSGELMAAITAARRFTRVCKKNGFANTEGSSHCLRANAQLQSWRLDQALQGFLHNVGMLGIMHRKVAIDSQVGLVLSYQALRRCDDAVGAMEQLMAFARDSGEPEHLAVAWSCQARLSLLQGDLTAAMDWARSFDGQAHAPSMLMWLEVPAITQLKIVVATGSDESLAQASESLATLRRSAEAMHNTYQLIGILALQCVALKKLGRANEALTVLQQAIALAEPGGWVYPFVEQGQPMAELLGHLADRRAVSDHVRSLLDKFPTNGQQPKGDDAGEPRTGSATSPATNPATNSAAGADTEARGPESLTRREFDVLELLAQRLQTKEIAARLFVSPETVKTHLKHLYQKIEVSNRREAAIKAMAIVSRRRDSSGIHPPRDAR